MWQFKSSPLALAFCLVLLVSCTVQREVNQTQTHLQDVEDFRSVDLDTTSTLLSNYRTSEEDEVLYELEYATLNHYRESWEESATHFQNADQAIERHYTKDISKNIQSFIVNDLQLPYAGEPYESIYLTNLNCFNYLHMGDLEGALVEIRRMNHKLELLNDRNKGMANALTGKELEGLSDTNKDTAQAVVEQADEELEDIDLLTGEKETPPEIQQHSSLGRFLSVVLYAKTGSPDDARIELQKLRTALADQGRVDFLSALARADKSGSSTGMLFPTTWGEDESTASTMLSTLFKTPYMLFGTGEQPSSSGEETLSSVSVPSPNRLTQSSAYNTLFVTFTGQAPRKREKSFSIPLVIKGEKVQLDFAVPVLETSESRVDQVRALVVGDTLDVPMVEDMQAVAHGMFEKKKPVIYTRAVLRSFLKAGLTEAAEKEADDELGGAAGFLTEKVGEAMSKQAAQADTRAWQTMPGRAHAVAAKLPEGTHEVTFEYVSEQGHVLKRRTRSVTVGSTEDFALAESIYLN